MPQNNDNHKEKMITVFTPTYNRAYILGKLYNSLKKQSSPNFEWIIIDDDSTDNTEYLVSTFENVGEGITYIKQPHGGKHRAINKAAKIAKGDYFFIVDSDDYLTSDAIELVNTWVSKIDKDNIAGVAGLRASVAGKIWGDEPKINKGDYIEASNLERTSFNLEGDKAEVYSTKILREHPFPEFENEYFVTEAVVWDWIALDGYKLRWYNRTIYLCEYLDDGLTKTGANDTAGHVSSPHGFGRYVAVELKAYGIKRNWADFWGYCRIAHSKRFSKKQRLDDLQIGLVTYCYFKTYSLIMAVYRKLRKSIKGNNS